MTLDYVYNFFLTMENQNYHVILLLPIDMDRVNKHEAFYTIQNTYGLYLTNIQKIYTKIYKHKNTYVKNLSSVSPHFQPFQKSNQI